MPKAAENETSPPAPSTEPANSQDVDEMIAEAKAVEALFERMLRRPLNIASAVTAYFSPRAGRAKPDSEGSGD